MKALCRGLARTGLLSRGNCYHGLRVKLFCSTPVREPGGTLEEDETSKQFRATMRLVPSSGRDHSQNTVGDLRVTPPRQSSLHVARPSLAIAGGSSQLPIYKSFYHPPDLVAVVTTGDGTVKRGVTCSSFTSVSLQPPMVSFSMQQPSRMHDLLLATQRFAVHVLSEKQVHYSVHFSRPVPDYQNQFDSIPHQLGLAPNSQATQPGNEATFLPSPQAPSCSSLPPPSQSVPLLLDCCAVLQCATHTVHSVGDHYVWYGKVLHAAVQANETPLLYYARSYHSVGDAAFMRAFETATLGYEEWTHEAHLRMAWNYITVHGKEEATPLIKAGISNYIDKNIGKVKNIYNETITLFFIHMVDRAVQKFEGRPHLFEEFLAQSPHLLDVQLLSRHYTAERIRSMQARERWLEPDLEPLP